MVGFGPKSPLRPTHGAASCAGNATVRALATPTGIIQLSSLRFALHPLQSCPCVSGTDVAASDPVVAREPGTVWFQSCTLWGDVAVSMRVLQTWPHTCGVTSLHTLINR